MDIDSKINNFELVLREYSATKSLLYGDKNIKDAADDGLKSIDVIKNISKQIKSINNDEAQKKTKNSKLNVYKKSNFIPVNMLSLEPQQKPGTSNNFETQYVFDTQLLTVIKDAEAIIDTRTGVTQEFETSFEQILDSKQTQVNKVVNTNCEEMTSLKSQCKKIPRNSEDLKQNLPSQSESSKELFARNQNYLGDDKQSQRNGKLLNKDSQRNKFIDARDELEIYTEQNFNVPESKEGSLSPIFNSRKSIHAHKIPSITCMLDSFEKFEAIAGPIVQENSNLESVKRIINSRLLSNELFISDHREHSNENSEHLSPILKIKSEISESEKIVTPGELEEEILFSSDEETDYMQNQSKELPLTCALETSFYKQEDVLDKTMYVGFQTASNKSIQVLTNSFSKAKSTFNNIHEDGKKYSSCLTLSELVEVYDGALKQKNDVTEDSCKEQMDVGEKLKDNEYKLNTIDKESAANEIKVGFRTARGSSINISDKAWCTSKMIFNDIDEIDKVEGNISTVVDVSYFNENQENINNTVRGPKQEILIQTDKLASCTSNTQEQINIDDYMVREFEESLLFINDNKLHTNFDIVNHPLKNDTKDCNDKQLVNLHKNLPNSKCGFTIATNKTINISEEGINKMKNIFDDKNIMNNLAETNKKSNEMLQEIDFQSNLINYNIGKEGKKQLSKNIAHNDKKINERFFQEFESASNYAINISEEGLTKSNKIFQKFDFQSNLTKVDMDKAKWSNQFSKDIIHNDKKTNKEFFQGFKTASNKPINISEEALLVSNKILQEFDFQGDLKGDIDKPKCNKQFLKDKTHNDNKIEKRCFQGFATASNNPIHVSEEALAKCNKILQEFDFQKDLADHDMNKAKCNKQFSKDVIHNDKKENKGFFQGFKTASNKPINVSKKALVESNKILQEFDFESDLTDDMNKSKCNNQFSKDMTYNDKKTEKGSFQGFATASNNPINISEKALANSKRILDFDKFLEINTDDDCTEKEPKNCIKKSTHFVEGFTTASNKRVKISNEALARAKYVFQDIPQNHDNITTLDIHNKELKVNGLTAQENEFRGFKTANNELVKISKESLAKSKSLFQDINIENDLPDKQMIKSTNFKIMGFQTANNEDVCISEEALRKSKKIFEDININLKKGIKQKLKTDCMVRQNIAFKAPNNNNHVQMCDTNFETRELFANADKKTVSHQHLKTNDIDNIIDTKMMIDFEETMYTEDFLNASPTSKRSGSPILSCPKAKKIKIKTNNEIKLVDHHITKMNQYAFNTNYKKIKKYKLLDIYQIENESHKLASRQDVHYNIDNILNFEFVDARNEISNVKWTTDNIKKYFLGSVNKKIIPEGWIENHMKLILLKLISYEKRFPNAMGCVCSVNNVMEQLKYRYERELYNVERPALRKILEKDEVPHRRLVLNVLNIYIDGVSITNATSVVLTENIELLLSDGWYCVKATIDKMLVKLVRDSKIVVGTKLITQGAELLNCEQGVAPWENTSSIRLKIFGNSTRRTHWATRLGFHGNGAILSHLTTVEPEGGKISQLRVVVTRVYPMLYVEKFDDGSTVTRSERLENLHQMKYETEREILLEKVYEEVEKEFSNQDSQDCESVDVDTKSLESGSQVYQLLRKSRDPVEFMANLSQSHAKLLQEYIIKRREISLQDIQCKVQDLLKKRGLNIVRNVVPMLKIRVADVYKVDVTKAMITIWRPNESLLHIFQEGTWVDIFNIVPTAVRYSEIQISAGKQSVFRKTLKVNDQMANTAKSFQRKCYMISELIQNPHLTTDYNEVDTVGFVFDTEPSVKEFDSKKQLFQNVFLADVNKKIICINFWGGLKKFGFENILETGQVVACVNLQKRSGNTRKNIPQYRATEFSYFTKTPKIDISRKICDDLSKQFLSLDRRKFIQDCIILRNNFVNIKYGNIENISPYRFNNSDYNMSKNKAFINSPIGDINLNLNWLDFESTFKQTDTELSPKRLLRKKEISEKIARLKKYGEPPPLSSIHIVNKNKDAAKPYKSPLVSKNETNTENQSKLRRDNTLTAMNSSVPLILNTETTPNATNSHLNATSNVTKSSNNQCTSPVLPYRCRTVNPVKLTFSKQNNISKDDPFGEDFESSPPLSLD